MIIQFDPPKNYKVKFQLQTGGQKREIEVSAVSMVAAVAQVLAADSIETTFADMSGDSARFKVMYRGSKYGRVEVETLN